LQSLRKIVRRGGIATVVKGQKVVLKCWIHYIIGDTSGNNRIAGHFNGSGKIVCPYRDCMCPYCSMDDSNPACVYVTLNDYFDKKAEWEDATSKTAKQKVDKSWSKHNIENALIHEHIPMSDPVHGIFRMLPPELLHITQEGTSEYIFKVLSALVGNNGARAILERVHQHLHNDRKRNSERDFPRSAARSGLLKDTLINASERRGNLFLLLCISHTDTVQNWLWPLLNYHDIDPEKYIECLKMYLAMEEWMHATNLVEEVRNARGLISKVLDMVKDVFPREQGQGWKLPKMHGLTKMQSYICLFGSGINFFGGPGESYHKKFVKDTGNNTQGRVDSFSHQVADRIYEKMLYELAKKTMDKRDDSEYELLERTSDDDAFTYTLSGLYQLTVKNISLSGTCLDYTTKRNSIGKNGQRSIDVNRRFLDAVTNFAVSSGWSGPLPLSVSAFTSCKILLGGRLDTYRATENYGDDGQWYDWCLFDDIDENNNIITRPGCLLGIFQFRSNVFPTDDRDQTYVCLQAADTLLDMNNLEEDFISKFEMSDDVNSSTYMIPLECISSPLFVYRNYGGSSREYFCALPKRKWGRYFGDKVLEE
jgi:hypothetical protein